MRFQKLFEEIHSDYMGQLSQKFPSISPAELRICVLVKSNLSTKEIAHLLSLSEHTVAVHRYSIRKKLGIRSGIDLVRWLSALQHLE